MPLLLIIVTLTLTLTLTQVEPAAGAVMAAMLRVSREHELHAVEDRSVPVSDAEVQVRERDRETERERHWPHNAGHTRPPCVHRLVVSIERSPEVLGAHSPHTHRGLLRCGEATSALRASPPSSGACGVDRREPNEP